MFMSEALSGVHLPERKDIKRLVDYIHPLTIRIFSGAAVVDFFSQLQSAVQGV
jgi:hypothetical protein